MEKEVLEQFKNKTIKIWTTHNWMYRGKIVSLSDTTLGLDDIQSGLSYINLTSIQSVEEWNPSQANKGRY